MKRKKRLLMVLAGVMSLVIVVAATFAWFTSKDQKVNHFETKQITDGSVNLVEIFDPPTDWKPGQEVIKNVSVANNGEVDVLVRISFEEILKKLASGGDMTDLTTPTLDATQTAAGWLPVHVTLGGYTSAKGWSDMDTADVVGGLPTNVAVKVKSATDPASGSTVYTFLPYYKLSDGSFQKVTADITKDKITGKFTLADVKYYFFDGKTTTYGDWANKNEYISTTPATPITPLPNADFDFTGKTSRIVTDELLTLKYGALMQTMTANNWWYNEADGYFYYIGKLASGEISPLILETVTLSSEAGNEYSLMELDLAVLMDAIQNTTDAMTATDGWNLSNAALISALTPFCE